MAEPDDVERLVERVTQTKTGLLLPVDGEGVGAGEIRDAAILCSGSDVLRLARIVRELLAEHQSGECHEYDCGCSKAWPAIPSTWCTPCRNRALRERLCRIARGEA